MNNASFHPITVNDVTHELAGLPDDLQDAIVEWWNESRRSRHGQRAVWTRRAFSLSSNRVQATYDSDPSLARKLVEAGVEFGWMGLNVDFVKSSSWGQANSSRIDKAVAEWNNAKAQH